MIYLDNNATTRPSTEARDAMLRAMDELWHNPSSIYRAGQAAKRAVELGRASIAKLINGQPKEIVFCGCGTCSIHTAMAGVIATHKHIEKPNIISTHIEHPAVRAMAQQVHERFDIQTRWLQTSPGGRIDPASLADQIDESTILVSAQWANNETGVIHPVAELGKICRDKGVTFHVDGVQWVGKMPTNVRLGVISKRSDPRTTTMRGSTSTCSAFRRTSFTAPKASAHSGSEEEHRSRQARPERRNSADAAARRTCQVCSGWQPRLRARSRFSKTAPKWIRCASIATVSRSVC